MYSNLNAPIYKTCVLSVLQYIRYIDVTNNPHKKTKEGFYCELNIVIISWLLPDVYLPSP